MEVVLLNTSRDNPLLVYQGYSYIQDGSYKNKIYWKCEHSRNPAIKCHARLHTDAVASKVIFISSQTHNHGRNACKLEIRKVYDDLKQCATTEQPMNDIIVRCTSKMSVEARKKLTKLKHIKRLVHYHRKKQIKPIAKETLSDANLLLTKTLKNESFLQYDSGEESENRFMIFSTEDNLHLLEDALDFHMDSTSCQFIVPDSFSKFCIFYVNRNNEFIPALYALLKSEVSYDLLFGRILMLIPNWNPLLFISDFEIKPTNSVRRIFPGISVIGSYVHYKRIIFQRLQVIIYHL
ncbi:unnamed protein product [Didymodactylos carnosus]|uniref:FLYWCH-type domain-containing protein n=1 Tax=Didymodactylos carnosus TaxID=1234261 RepID=A0A815QFE8_9BILA|nr:unnamed protein product [Didymodactylos carnosus]CAF1462479.1 unnamed protein product [Didymodactylos carnosus]CAF3790464.1 unnamed protein product [Didymodactylos carnosus]CAF4332426.1 unnamed protein product [Didymodactylos carnosus]